jgi:hypothetical protein
MAHFSADEQTLHLHPSALEMLGALHGDVAVPLAQVSAVSVETQPWRALRGLRFGTGIPWVIAYGIRFGLGGGRRDFALVRGGGPAVRVECGADAPFARLLVTVRDPEATTAMIRRAAQLA